MCLFDNKQDLLFMFTLLPDKFINLCTFLNIICYENKDDVFSERFILYIMNNNIIITNDYYFMNNEIRSINNYLNNEIIDMQIKSCTPIFYSLYLNEYKEKVIEHIRHDIYDLIINKQLYYPYVNMYENTLTMAIKETKEYNEYIHSISLQLIPLCKDIINFDTIRELIKYGANINIVNNYESCLFNAIEVSKRSCALNVNNYELIIYLLEHGANVNVRDKDRLTPLSFLCRTYERINNKQQIDNLINIILNHDTLIKPPNINATVNVQTSFGHTPLSFCDDSATLIKLLIEHNANINLQNIEGINALHMTAVVNNLEGITHLIEHGANVNVQNIYGNAELFYALKFKRDDDTFEDIKYLINHGSNINLQNNDNNTILHLTANKPDKLEIKYLITSGANINLQNNDGNTALHVAFYKRKYIHGVTFLINNIANYDNIHSLNYDDETETTWFNLEWYNNINIIHCLIDNGADVNIQNNDGDTVLMLVSKNDINLDMIKYLIEHGAYIHLQNNNNESAFTILSKQTNNIELMQYIRQFK